MRNIVLLLFFVLSLTACESSNIVILPEIAGQFISFKIDGQEQRLSSLRVDGVNQSVLVFSSNGVSNSLSLYRYSSDGNTALRLKATDLPVIQKPTGPVFDGDGFTPATMLVSSSSMSGSFYCPHLEVGEAVSYGVLLRFDSLDENGRMRGTFKEDPNADNIVHISDGRFDLDVLQF